ncbi:antibiotic biosynthesis monooxygenase [bacterium]|nr:antibiotic biosynthesis monooxygenase [bacterium]
MIVRLVHLTIRADQVDAFLKLFERSKHKIKASPGCLHLELIGETDQPHKLSTLSRWDSVSALDEYRNSDFFRETWALSKTMFADRALAQSYQVVSEID